MADARPGSGDDKTRQVTGTSADERRMTIDAARHTREVGGGRAGALTVQVAGSGAARRGKLLEYRSGDVIDGKYKIWETVRFHDAVHAGIYFCTVQAGELAGRRVVLKVHGRDRAPDPQLLERVQRLAVDDIVRVYDAFELEGNVAELIEYCEGGPVSHYAADSPQVRGLSGDLPCEPLTEGRIIEEIVPEVNNALGLLHEAGIVHRDIKPDNIFFRRFETVNGRRRGRDVVIGDFDISYALGEDTTSRITSLGAFTDKYLPPESFIHYFTPDGKSAGWRVSREMDYYALGITILELLGIPIFRGMDYNSIAKFYTSERLTIPQQFSQRLRVLLQALLLRDYRRRWTAKQVALWARGELNEAPAETWVPMEQGLKPRRYQGRDCRTFADMAAVMDTNPDAAIKDLMEQAWVEGWVADVDMDRAAQIRDAKERFRHQPPLVLLATRLILDPLTPLALTGGKSVSSPPEFSAFAGEGRWSGTPWQAAFEAFESGRLEVWLEYSANGSPELARRIRELRKQSRDHHHLLEEALYICYPHRPYFFQPGRPAETPEQLAELILGSESDWSRSGNDLPACYQEGLKQVKEGRPLGWLRVNYHHLHEQYAQLLSASEDEILLLESFLRQCKPDLPLLDITLTLPTAVSGEWSVAHGREDEQLIACRTSGRGVPAVSLTLEHPDTVLLAETVSIRERQAQIRLRVNARHNDVKANYTARNQLHFASVNCRIDGQAAPFALPLRYRVTYPFLKSLAVLVTWAAGGAAALGLLRLMITGISGPGWLFEDKSRLLDIDKLYDTIYGEAFVGVQIEYFFYLILLTAMVYMFIRVRRRLVKT